MVEDGMESKLEGEMEAVVILRLIWNHPVIHYQEEKNENVFKLAGKACDDAAREVCVGNGLWVSLLNSCQMPIIIHASNRRNCNVQ